MASLAQDAMQYQGHAYTFGGVPAHNQWDCSSFVNKCAGMDLGLAIPGYKAGQYTGQNHGPVVIDWATWGGCTTIKGPPQNSDLCVWPGVGALGHIGIAIDGQSMISALNHVAGTLVTPIAGHGPIGVPVMYRRINNLSGNATLTSALSSSGAGCVPLIYYVWLMSNALREDQKFRRNLARHQFRNRRR